MSTRRESAHKTTTELPTVTTVPKLLRLEPLQTPSPYGNEINVDWQRSLICWSPGNGSPKIDLTWRTFENWTNSWPEDDTKIPKSSITIRPNWGKHSPPNLQPILINIEIPRYPRWNGLSHGSLGESRFIVGSKLRTYEKSFKEDYNKFVREFVILW